MDLQGTATVGAAPNDVGAVVRDLATYPQWLGIVGAALKEAEDGAWRVDLVGRLGPLKRTKRVRMERVVDGDEEVVFERVERDGEEHSVWRLTVKWRPHLESTQVDVHLHYSGAPTLPLVELLLRDEIRRAGPRLDAVIKRR